MKTREYRQKDCFLATVPYSNAWPLTHFLRKLLPEVTVTTCFPSEMLAQLRTECGTDSYCVAGLLPIAELATLPDRERPNFRILGDACVSCIGDVRSVLLWSRCELDHIRTLALDGSSRSSVALAQILLRKYYHCCPELVTLPAGYDWTPLNECGCDAMVVIGDRALAHEPDRTKWKFRYDLGSLWYRHTGLPFVFAAWITNRPQEELDRRVPCLVSKINQARDMGIAGIDVILDDKDDRKLPVARHLMAEYLRKNIQYRLGPPQWTAIQIFLSDVSHTPHIS